MTEKLIISEQNLELQRKTVKDRLTDLLGNKFSPNEIKKFQEALATIERMIAEKAVAEKLPDILKAAGLDLTK